MIELSWPNLCQICLCFVSDMFMLDMIRFRYVSFQICLKIDSENNMTQQWNQHDPKMTLMRYAVSWCRMRSCYIALERLALEQDLWWMDRWFIDWMELIDLIDNLKEDHIPSRSPDSHCLDLEHTKIAPFTHMSNDMGISQEKTIKGASDVLPSLIRLRTYTLTHHPKHKLSHSGCREKL